MSTVKTCEQEQEQDQEQEQELEQEHEQEHEQEKEQQLCIINYNCAHIPTHLHNFTPIYTAVHNSTKTVHN